MFLNLLNERQKIAFATLATRITVADNKVYPQEFSLMNILHAEMGWDIKAGSRDLKAPPDYAAFDTARSKMIALIELHVVAISESILPPEEITILEEAREALGFSPDQASCFQEWARRITPLMLHAWHMIDEERPLPLPDTE